MHDSLYGPREVVDDEARILLVDEHPAMRSGLAQLLRRRFPLAFVFEAAMANVTEVIAEMPMTFAVVDVVIAMSLMGRIVARCHRVLGLSSNEDPVVIADALRAGAGGCVLKTQPAEEILDATAQVLAGQRYLPPSVPGTSIDEELAKAPRSPLSRREREVLELVVRGLSNDEIGSTLFISRRTVETHRVRIVRKLGARTFKDLQRLAAHHR